jgi:LysR family glycine cleavage system transcriptional activator
VHAEKLFDEWLLPVCSPSVYEKYGPLHKFDDLRRYPLLHGVYEPWTLWLFDGHPVERAAVVRGALFDDSDAIVRMAVRGAGLALGRWSLVADEIASGTLVRASSRAVRFQCSYWLVYPPRSESLAAVRSFNRWIREEASSFAMPEGARLGGALPREG